MTLHDTDLLYALGELLAERVADRAVAGLAVHPAPDAPLEVLWTPAGDTREPGFPAYSITKTFTAAIALQLVDEGRLSLGDRLARWAPSIDRADRISVRELLQHRAGIPDYGGLPAYHEAVRNTPGTPWRFEDYARETWERGLLFEPGEAFAYSNPGYLLLTRILEECSGDSYRELVASRIAGPLGLARTFAVKTIADWSTLAPGLTRLIGSSSEPVDVRGVYHPGWVSHGVVASTPSEILTFFEALFEGRLVSAGALAEMTRIVSIGREAPGYGNPSYGFGLMGDLASPIGQLGHNGGGPGYSASVFRARLREGAATACVMSGIEEDEFAFDLVRAIFELLQRY